MKLLKLSREKLRELIYEFIRDSDGRTRQEINEYIYPMLDMRKNDMNNKVRTILTYLKKKDLIKNLGSDTKPKWSEK